MNLATFTTWWTGVPNVGSSFFAEDDYREFEALIEETIARIPLCILTYELLPNH